MSRKPATKPVWLFYFLALYLGLGYHWYTPESDKIQSLCFA